MTAARPADAGSTRRSWTAPWLTPVLLFVGAFAVYFPTSAGDHSPLNLDVWSANYASWHIATTGSPWLEGVHIPPLDNSPIRDVWIRPVHGHTVIGRAPGVVAVALPAYWIAHPAHMTTRPGGVTAALLVASAVVFMFLAIKARTSAGTALVSALVFGFATPVWSIGAEGVWPQTVTVFGIGGMAWAATRQRWWWVGVFGGVTLWARLPSAVVVAVVGLGVGWHRRSPGIVLKVASTSSLFLAGMCVWTRWMYGSWNPTASYDSATLASHAAQNWHSVTNQLGFWVSPDRGLLIWSPVVLVLLPALARSWRTQPDWARSLLVGGLAYSVLQSALNPFTGGDLFYGYRYGIGLAACATPAFAFAVAYAGRTARALLPAVVSVQLFAIATGAVSDDYLLPEQDVWHRNAFVAALDSVGLTAWAGVVALVVLVELGAMLWRRRVSPVRPAPRPLARPEPASSRLEAGESCLNAGI